MQYSETLVRSIEELERFAAEFLRSLTKHETGATMVGLTGDLGSGKTAFTRALGKALGVTEEITSPTFVIARFYDLPRAPWKTLIHMDAYRIDDPSELTPLRWDTIRFDPTNLVVVEWPERLKNRFPSDSRVLQFMFIDETTRRIGNW